MIADSLPKIWQTHPDEILPGLSKIQQMAQGGLAEMRNLLVELSPQKLTEKPLGELLRQLAHAIANRRSLNITTRIDRELILPPQVQICFYRVAQESLNNVARHARATQAEIHLNCQNLDGNSEQVKMLVRDNGLGFNQEELVPSNLGINIMKQRAEQIGAILKITSQPYRGTEVSLKWSFSGSL